MLTFIFKMVNTGGMESGSGRTEPSAISFLLAASGTFIPTDLSIGFHTKSIGAPLSPPYTTLPKIISINIINDPLLNFLYIFLIKL